MTTSRGYDRARTDAEDARIGGVELGSFRVISRLGEGTFGTAYLTEQLRTERKAVLKVAHALLVRGPTGKEVRRRFAAELRAATKVKHPNLVTIFTSGETHDGLPAIAMEYVEGETLGGLLQREAPLRGHRLGIFQQLASALDSIHGQGILHRDVAPGNVMVTRDHDGEPQAVLLDFGMAMFLGHGNSHRLVGTPHFVAPEQLRMAPEPASDMHGLGALLWWALCGQPMRRGPSGYPVELPQTLNPSIQDETAQFLEQLVHVDPAQRPTAAEFMQRWPALAASFDSEIAVESQRSSYPVASSIPAAECLRVLVLEPNPVWRRMLGKVVARSGASASLQEKFELGYGDSLYDVIIASSQCDDAALQTVTRFAAQYPATQLILATRGEETRWSEVFDSEVTVPGELRAMEELLAQLSAQRNSMPPSQRSASWPGRSSLTPTRTSYVPQTDESAPASQDEPRTSEAPTLPPPSSGSAASASLPTSAQLTPPPMSEERMTRKAREGAAQAGPAAAAAASSRPSVRGKTTTRPGGARSAPVVRQSAPAQTARARRPRANPPPRRTTPRRMPPPRLPKTPTRPVGGEQLLGRLPDHLAELAEAASATEEQRMAKVCRDIARCFEQLGSVDSARIANMFHELLTHGAATDLEAIVTEIEEAYLEVFRSHNSNMPSEGFA